jgi:hypothetical protein
MKRFLPLLILFGLTTGMAQAQRLTEADDQLDKMVLALELSGPQMAILELKRELKLTEEQLMQVELLSEERFQRMSEAEMAMEDPLQLQRAFREIQLELDKVMAGILNEGQLKHYLELEGRQHVNLLTGKEDDE